MRRITVWQTDEGVFEFETDWEDTGIFEAALSVVAEDGVVSELTPWMRYIRKEQTGEKLRIRFCGRMGVETYTVHFKLLLDGRLYAVSKETVRCAGREQREVWQITAGSSQILHVLPGKEMTEMCIAARNPSCSWRTEGDRAVSIFCPDGRLLFFQDTIRDIWTACRGKNTVRALRSELGVSESLLRQALEILDGLGVVILFEESREER